MRLWSLHPQYLDAKGLVALWREGLLPKHVLEGKTKGYRHHPQLQRFRAVADPERAINQYLHAVLSEAEKRGYRFDASKLASIGEWISLPVTKGQLAFEANHLLQKLAMRDKERFDLLKQYHQWLPHPLFYVVEGGVED